MGRDRRPPDDYPPEPPDDYGRDEYPTEPLRQEREPDPYRRTREYDQVRRRPPPEPPWRRENPWLWVALLAVLLVAGVTIAIFAFRDDDGSSTVTVTTGTTATTDTTATVTTQPPVVDVPDAAGETQLSAVTTIQNAGLVPNTYPVRGEQQRGTVVAQNPSGGQLTEGSSVRLNVSSGTGDVPEVGIPDVTGLSADQARLNLARAKLCMRALPRAAPDSGDVGQVLDQSPAAGTSSSQFTQVTLYVGN